jgi:hypothetical protein
MLRVAERQACSCLRFPPFCARVGVLVAFAAGSCPCVTSVCRSGAEQSSFAHFPFPSPRCLHAQASKAEGCSARVCMCLGGQGMQAEQGAAAGRICPVASVLWPAAESSATRLCQRPRAGRAHACARLSLCACLSPRLVPEAFLYSLGGWAPSGTLGRSPARLTAADVGALLGWLLDDGLLPSAALFASPHCRRTRGFGSPRFDVVSSRSSGVVRCFGCFVNCSINQRQLQSHAQGPWTFDLLFHARSLELLS